MTLAAYLFAALDSSSDEHGALEQHRRARATILDNARETSDEALFARVQTGDERAFEQLFERHSPLLTHLASSLAHSADVAEDVVQAVFLRLWRRRDVITIHGNVAQYLRSAIYNEVKNVLTSDIRRYRRGEFAERDRDSNERSITPDAITEEHELADIVRHAIDALPARSGEIFRVWFYTDLSYAEIAETLGISVKGVEQGRARAIASLRRTLLPLLQGGRE